MSRPGKRVKTRYFEVQVDESGRRVLAGLDANGPLLLEGFFFHILGHRQDGITRCSQPGVTHSPLEVSPHYRISGEGRPGAFSLFTNYVFLLPLG